MALKALYLNTSLKHGDDQSNTEALMRKSMDILGGEDVESELLRISDYNIKVGMSGDMGEGDEWPMIYKKIIDADILVIGNPIWNGQKSSIAALVMERIYSQSSENMENGMAKYIKQIIGYVITCI